MSSVNQYSMQDPTTQYPQPPFREQPQDAPGLASRMDPKPDHGEESYVGFGRLKGRKALITGADSGIGRAVAIAFAREGADLFLNYLPSEQSDAEEVVAIARKAGVGVHTQAGDLKDETFCKELIETAEKQLGGLDILVNVAGHQAYMKASWTSRQPISTTPLKQTSMLFSGFAKPRCLICLPVRQSSIRRLSRLTSHPRYWPTTHLPRPLLLPSLKPWPNRSPKKVSG